MKYNYHTHTYRCSHATGTEEEYIKRAIENGVTHMGFSDHVPFASPDGFESAYRVPIAQVKDYYDTVAELREKYKDKIDIKISFEMEYYENSFGQMLKNAIEYGGEYLILGQHFLHEEYMDGGYTASENYSIDDLKKYVDCVVSAIKSSVFTYVAHPDVFDFRGSEDVYREEMRKICIASRKNNIPLEINFLGIRDNRMYPNSKFWEIVGEEKSPVTFGFDAHDIEAAFDGESLKKAKEMVKKYSLNYIGKPKIIDISAKPL